MGSVIKIYEALLNRKEKVCTKADIMEIIDEYNRALGKISRENAFKYLSRHNYIKRIFMHYYYINSLDEKERRFCHYEDRELLFAVLNRENIKWYLGLASALYMSGKIWQIPRIITIINNRISGKRKIIGLNARFIKAKERLIFGLKKGKTKNGVSYSYSDYAKTLIDIAYFGKSGPLKLEKNAENYIKRYPKWVRRLT
ncbi:MAG: hypothetical protein V1734_00745 [Nanoarchaeota archaeon]